MSGKVSVRRTGFKRVIQHEVSLGPLDMGGPLFDLEGRQSVSTSPRPIVWNSCNSGF